MRPEPTVILVPVLGRPKRVWPSYLSIEAATPEPHRVLYMVNGGDLKELRALQAAGLDYVKLPSPRKSFAKKVNDGFARTTEPFLFTAADDLHFHPGWLSAAFEKMEDGIGVVGTNDLLHPCAIRSDRGDAGTMSTHSLIRREYIERNGTIDEPLKVFHEGYPHGYCDLELVETARSRRAYAHAFDSVVEHLHHKNSKSEYDATYRLGARGNQQGKPLFRRRRALWRPKMFEVEGDGNG